MKKIFVFILLIASIAAHGQTPNKDSLIRFNNKYIRNSAIEAFTNLRLNTLLRWMILTTDSSNHTSDSLLLTKVDKVTGRGLSTHDYRDADSTKLAGIAAGATANSTDAQLRDRTTHSGVQPATSITEDATHRFATDAEKTTWNAKEDASNKSTSTSLGSSNTLYPTQNAVNVYVNRSIHDSIDAANIYFDSSYFSRDGSTPSTSLQLSPNAPLSTTQQAAISAKTDTSRTVLPFDYTVYRIGSTFYAIARTASGLPNYSNARADSVSSFMVAALIPSGGARSGGGRIMWAVDGEIDMYDETTIIGWEPAGTNFSGIEICGMGMSTWFRGMASGKNLFVVKNRANVVFRNFQITIPTGGLSGILLDNTGSVSERSINKGIIDHVWINSQGSAPAFWAKNFFNLSVPWLWAENTNNDGVRLENASSTTNYGNSNFGFLQANGSSSYPYGGLKIVSTVSPKFMNLVHFDAVFSGRGYYNLYMQGANYNTIGLADLEFSGHNIYLDGTSTAGMEVVGNTISSGSLYCNIASDTAIYASNRTQGNSIKVNITADDSTVIMIDDHSSGRIPNDYDVTTSPSANSSLINLANNQTPIRVRARAGSGTIYSSTGAYKVNGLLTLPDPASGYLVDITDGIEHYGLAKGTSTFQYLVPTTAERHAFGYGTPGAGMVEVLTVKGPLVGIGNPAPSDKLDVIGNGNQFRLRHSANSAFDYLKIDVGSTGIANFTVSGSAPGISLPSTTSIGPVTATELGYLSGVTSALQTQLNGKQASGSYELTTDKDATGGYPGLTLYKINFKNAANTFVSYLTNANTASRTYTYPDKDMTVADNADVTTNTSNIATNTSNISTLTTKVSGASQTEIGYLAGVTSALQTQLNGKQASGSYEVTTNKDATGGYAGLTLFKINFKNAANTFTSFLTNANSAARTYTFPDKDMTVADNADVTTNATNIAANTAALNTKAAIMSQIYSALGSTTKFDPFFGDISRLTTNTSLSSQGLRLCAVYIPYATTITGVKFFQFTQGSYTANNYNGVGLYSYSGGTLTLVASSTNDGTLWTGAAGAYISKAFSSPYSAAAGLYFIGALYCSSAQTTAPALGSASSVQSSFAISADFTNSAKLNGTIASLTALPSSQAMSGVTISPNLFYFSLY